MTIRDAEAEVVASGHAGVVVELRYRLGSSSEVHQHYQALRMRDGQVFDMQDYHQKKAAVRAVSR
jgi:hypothetical protein